MKPVLPDVLNGRRLAFARTTLVAPYLTAKLASVLAKITVTEAATRLDDAAQTGLGTWQTSPRGERVFCFDERVRDYLGFAAPHPVLNSEERFNAAVVARWLLREQDDPHTALRCAALSGDIDLVAAAGLRAYPFTRESSEIAARILHELPPEQRRRHPLLSMWLGAQLALQPGGVSRATEYFGAAGEAAFDGAETLPVTEQVMLAGAQSYLLRRMGNAAQSKAKARIAYRRGADLLRARRADFSLRHSFVGIMHQVGVSLVYAGMPREARDLFETLFGYCDEISLGHRRNTSASALSFLHAQDGDVRRARKSLAMVRVDDWPAEWDTGHTAAFQDLAEMTIAMQEADQPALERALARFRDHELETEHWDVVLAARVGLELLRGDVVSAVAWFEKVVSDRLTTRTHPSITARLTRLHLMLRSAGGSTRVMAVSRVSGRQQGVMDKALRTIIVARSSRPRRAAQMITDMAREADSPVEEMVTAIAAVVVAARSGLDIDVRQVRATIRLVAEAHGVRFPLILLTSRERELLSDSGSVTPVVALFEGLPAHGDDSEVDAAVPQLTPQEQRVVAALLEHETRAAVAENLHLSVNTVKVHLSAAYRKLGARSRTEALMKAALYDLLPAGTDRLPRR